MIEPIDAHCLESDPCDGLTRVHGRHPVWTRLEPALEPQDNFRVRRDTGATGKLAAPNSTESRAVNVNSHGPVYPHHRALF
jgi:hypothetical protein